MSKLRASCTKYIFALPLLILLGGVGVYPLVKLGVLSFSIGMIGAESSFGIENYTKALLDPFFWNSMRVTLLFVVIAVSIQFGIGLGLALLTQRLKSGALRAILLFPMMTSPITVGMVWRLMYHPMFGIINQVLHFLRLAPQGWLADPKLALPSVIISDIWQWTAFIYLVLVAGLQSIPKDYYEAAQLDGATRWQIFRHITFPLLKATIYIALLFRSMSAFKVFGKLVTLTWGGPGRATEVLALYIYKTTFQYLEIGYGAALAMIAVLFIIAYNEFYTHLFSLRKGG